MPIPLPSIDFEPSVVWRFLFNSVILEGAQRTLVVALIAQVLGVALGVVSALMRMSKNPLLSGPANFYVWFFRGTPLLIQLLFWYNGVPQLFNNPDITRELTSFRVAIFGLAVNEGAYMTEIVRAGIESVEGGQMDAAKSLGMTYATAMRRIILPQALRVVLPPTGNEFIAMLKNSSLAFAIGLVELSNAARSIYSVNYNVMELLVVASIWYLVMTTIFSLLQAELESRLSIGQRDRPPTLFGRMTEAFGARETRVH
ncbi:MAG TPA: amino acid ABC transporter permease [Dehalococcoidia bacterium]|nr:amino acid ABC transporter permease [Dehalococcoidia bacterium]